MRERNIAVMLFAFVVICLMVAVAPVNSYTEQDRMYDYMRLLVFHKATYRSVMYSDTYESFIAVDIMLTLRDGDQEYGEMKIYALNYPEYIVEESDSIEDAFLESLRNPPPPEHLVTFNYFDWTVDEDGFHITEIHEIKDDEYPIGTDQVVERMEGYYAIFLIENDQAVWKFLDAPITLFRLPDFFF